MATKTKKTTKPSKQAVKKAEPDEESGKKKASETPEEKPEKDLSTEARDVSEAKITSFSQVDKKEESSQEETLKETPEETQDQPPEEEKAKTAGEEGTATEETTIMENAGGESLKEEEVDSEPEKGIKKIFKPKLLLGLALVIVILAVVVGGIFYFKSGVEKRSPQKETKTEEPLPTPSPTPTPEPEGKIDLSDYSISVLNGSGVAGEAGKVKGLLETEGFEEISTDNADSYDYTNTEVGVKKDTPEEVYEAIKEALEDDYDVVKSEVYLSEDASFDIIVIVGTRKAE